MITTRASVATLLVVGSLSLLACHSTTDTGRLDAPEPGEPDTVVEAVEGVGTALNPVTGGLSGLTAALLLGGLELYRRNRQKRQIIDAIDDNKDTPTAAAQVVGDKRLAKVAGTLTGDR